MALPRHLKNGLTPLEIEFLAENEPIEIAAAIDTRQDLELIAVHSKQKQCLEAGVAREHSNTSGQKR